MGIVSEFAIMKCHLRALCREMDLIETILVIIIFLTLVSKTIQEKGIITVFVVSYLMSFVSHHVRGLHRENIFTSTKW